MAPLEQGLPVACVVGVAQDTVQVVFVEWCGLICIYECDLTHLDLSILAGSALCKQPIAVGPPWDWAALSVGGRGHDPNLVLLLPHFVCHC